MFGYINVNREKLNEHDCRIYQSYYCGLCRKLREEFGRKGQMLLNYDMAFLVILLTGLYELECESTEFICAMHPSKKRIARCNEATDYAAAMNLLLSAKNFEDDWNDDHSHTKKALAQMFKKDYERIQEKYPRQEKAITEYLRKLDAAEKQRERNVDAVAGLTGEMLGEIFAWKKDDVWTEELRCLGFYMGKFIYLMDAYEDIEKDEKKRSYNVLGMMLQEQETKEDFETISQLMLTSMMAECAKSFERLPVLLHAEICRNILYSGAWSKYEYLRYKNQAKKQPRKKAEHGKKEDKTKKADKNKKTGKVKKTENKKRKFTEEPANNGKPL